LVSLDHDTVDWLKKLHSTSDDNIDPNEKKDEITHPNCVDIIMVTILIINQTFTFPML